MKLIIDIDEKDYKGIISHDYYGIYSGIVSRALYEATKIGKPLQAELDEIKAKILNLSFTGYADKPKLDRSEVLKILDNRSEVLKILENHIKENN